MNFRPSLVDAELATGNLGSMSSDDQPEAKFDAIISGNDWANDGAEDASEAAPRPPAHFMERAERAMDLMRIEAQRLDDGGIFGGQLSAMMLSLQWEINALLQFSQVSSHYYMGFFNSSAADDEALEEPDPAPEAGDGDAAVQT